AVHVIDVVTVGPVLVVDVPAMAAVLVVHVVAVRQILVVYVAVPVVVSALVCGSAARHPQRERQGDGDCDCQAFRSHLRRPRTLGTPSRSIRLREPGLAGLHWFLEGGWSARELRAAGG